MSKEKEKRDHHTSTQAEDVVPFCLWLSSIQFESPYRAIRPPPSDGVWYSPRMGTPSTTAVSCFNTSRPVGRTHRVARLCAWLLTQLGSILYVEGCYLGLLSSWQWLFHLLENERCCSRRRSTLRQREMQRTIFNLYEILTAQESEERLAIC